jgi:hypothetical protein
MENSGDPQELITEEERKEFMEIFSKICKDLRNSPEFHDLPSSMDWLIKVLEYNVPHGKLTR